MVTIGSGPNQVTFGGGNEVPINANINGPGISTFNSLNVSTVTSFGSTITVSGGLSRLVTGATIGTDTQYGGGTLGVVGDQYNFGNLFLRGVTSRIGIATETVHLTRGIYHLVV